MSYRLVVEQKALLDIKRHQKDGNKKLVAKIISFFDELASDPRSGTGKPEQLKGYAGETWSRRIDAKHRLIYQIREEQLVVIAVSAFGHYDQK